MKPIPKPSEVSNQSADRIRELNKLFEEGDISKKEYDAKKKVLLDGL